MARALRKIVRIDEEKCNGCGLCVPSCEEGAIQIIDGKARLVAENLCDGLGNCLGECPQGAITIEEREAEEFDEVAVAEHLGHVEQEPAACSGGCPGSRVMAFQRPEAEPAQKTAQTAPRRSELRNWPLQLTLVPVHAPWLENANLLISADCVPYALPDFHDELLAGRVLITACPKLDDTGPYLQKLTEIFRTRRINSVTVARMEVPCCAGLVALVRAAIEASGRTIPFAETIISIEGRQLAPANN